MTSVAELFHHACVASAGVVPWGEVPSLAAPGVYVVSTTRDPESCDGRETPPLDPTAIAVLLAARPEAAVDGAPATVRAVEERLQAMWPTAEPVVYVGLAGGSIQMRVQQFYRTRIGARAPHAGGWPLKMLDPSTLWVHFGAAADPDAAETAMIDRFISGLSADVRATLIDPQRPLPFANLTFPRGARKAHGFTGVKGTKASNSGTPERGLRTSAAKAEAADGVAASADASRLTQNVTPADVRKGQLRIPRIAKTLFPAAKARLLVDLAGQRVEGSWDPRRGPDRERSGVLRFVRAEFAALVVPGGPLRISTTDQGLRIQ